MGFLAHNPNNTEFSQDDIHHFPYDFRLVHPDVESNHVPRSTSIADVESSEKRQVRIYQDSGREGWYPSAISTAVPYFETVPIFRAKWKEREKTKRQLARLLPNMYRSLEVGRI